MWFARVKTRWRKKKDERDHGYRQPLFRNHDLLARPEYRYLKPNILGYVIHFAAIALYIRCMLPMYLLGEQIAIKRKSLGLTKPALAKKARVGLSTLDALENGRMGELGYSKITNILAALGMELKLQLASASRPTLEELMEEGRRDDQALDRYR
jgi:hypothetical protein